MCQGTRVSAHRGPCSYLRGCGKNELRRAQMSARQPRMTDYPDILTLAPPIRFPHAPFAEALRRHASILDCSLDTLVSLVLTFDHGKVPLSATNSLAGHIVLPRAGRVADFLVRTRNKIAAMVPRYRGVVQVLHMEAPGDHGFYVVIEAFDAVSLHHLRASMPEAGEPRISPRLEVVERDLVVEPLRQEHRECADATVTRWLTPKGLAHWSWVPTPRPPATPDEAIDRLLSQCEKRVALALEEALEQKTVGAPLVWLQSTRSGESVLVFDRRSLGTLPHSLVTEGTPEIERLLAREHRPGLLPVYIRTRRVAGLRWIDRRPVRGAAQAQSFTERVQWPLLSVPDRDTDDPDEPEAEGEALHAEAESTQSKAEARQRSEKLPGPSDAAEVWNAAMRVVRWNGMERIVTLAGDELDRELTEAGFDPADEFAQGPVLREEVLDALARRGHTSDAEP